MEKLLEIYGKLYEIQVDYSKLQWTLFTTGYDFGVEEKYLKMVEFLKDKTNYEFILKCKEKGLSPADERKVEIVYNVFRSYHLSEDLNKLDMEIESKVNELTKILNTFRYTFDGRKVSSVELNQILSMDNSRERRKETYFTKNQINKQIVAGGFIDLLDLRKEYAEKYGAENFIKYKLEVNELDKDIFDDWINQLHDVLPEMNKVRQKYANEILKDDHILPWDEQYIATKIAPSMNSDMDMTDYYSNIKELFSAFGIDVADFNITYDIFPRANKSEWGYNFPIETGRDSRILANVKNKYYEYGVLLHETGHAVHSFLLDPEKLILNEGVSGIISEGIANLFQSFLYSPIFYDKFFEDSEQIKREFMRLREYRKIISLRSLNRIFFDHSLYKNDVNNLDDIYSLYWQNQKEVLNEEPFGEEPPWAYMIHFTTHPIYLHNYFMGDVTREMLTKVFEQQFNSSIIEKPEKFSQFLISEVIKPSGLYKYNDLFKKISGEDFSIKYMIE